MKLTDLEPWLLRYTSELADAHHGRDLPDGTVQWGGFPTTVFYPVDTLPEADGVGFLCPLCFLKNNGPVGTHGIHVYFTGSKVPEGIGTNAAGATVRWDMSGSSLADLTLAPSIALESGCKWHGHIQNGMIVGGIPE